MTRLTRRGFLVATACAGDGLGTGNAKSAVLRLGVRRDRHHLRLPRVVGRGFNLPARWNELPPHPMNFFRASAAMDTFICNPAIRAMAARLSSGVSAFA
jgi:hypothetical protein